MEKNHRIDYDGLKMVEIGEFIRSRYDDWNIQIDGFIFWNDDGSFDRTSNYVYRDNVQKYRHPDIMVFRKGRLLFVMEIDGSIHDKKVAETERRNDEYFFAGIPLEVITESEYDNIYVEIKKRCDRWARLICT